MRWTLVTGLFGSAFGVSTCERERAKAGLGRGRVSALVQSQLRLQATPIGHSESFQWGERVSFCTLVSASA